MCGAEEVLDEMWAGGEAHPQAASDQQTDKMVRLRRELMGAMLGQLLLQHGNGR